MLNLNRVNMYVYEDKQSNVTLENCGPFDYDTSYYPMGTRWSLSVGSERVGVYRTKIQAMEAYYKHTGDTPSKEFARIMVK